MCSREWSWTCMWMHSHTHSQLHMAHTYTHMYAFTCTLMGECTHTWVFRVAPVLSDPWTKDLLPHRMAVVTKRRRVSRDRLTEAAYGETVVQPWDPEVPRSSLDLASVSSRHDVRSSGLVVQPEAALRAACCPELRDCVGFHGLLEKNSAVPGSLRTLLLLSQHDPEHRQGRCHLSVSQLSFSLLC